MKGMKGIFKKLLEKLIAEKLRKAQKWLEKKLKLNK